MRLAIKFGILAGLLTITSGAHAACNLTSDMTAVSVQTNQGQGGFTCASVVLPDGMPAVDLLSAGKILAVKPTGGSRTLDWSIQGADLGKTYPLALVRVLNNGEGSSCNYTYDGISTEDSGLGNLSAGPVKNGAGSGTLFCGSLTQVALPVEEEEATLPTTTAETLGCTGAINGAGSLVFDGGVVMAESLDGQTLAVCNAESGGGGLQAYCEDSCVDFVDVGESAACLGSLNAATGEFGLACKPCKTALELKYDTDPDTPPPPVHPVTGGTMEFCWEKTGSLWENAPGNQEPDLGGQPPDFEDGTPRNLDTMLKHTAIRHSDNTITWFNKCYKSKVQLNGRTYTVTTCK